MFALYPLFRLLWRPGVLWDLLVTAGFAGLLVLLGGKLGLFLSGVPEDGFLPDLSAGARELQVALLAGAVVGTVVNFAMQDLGYCRFSWSLPGLGRDLLRGFVAIALFTALGTGAVFALAGASLGFTLAAALALAGFGLGNQLWDAKLGRAPCFLAQFLLGAAVVGAERLFPFVEAHPMLTSLLALLLVATSLRRSSSRGAARVRALVPAIELGASFHPPADVSPARPAALARPAARRLWSGGPIADRRSWVQAFYHETSGWVRGGWRWQSTFIVIPVAILLSAFDFYFGWSRDGSIREGFSWIYQGLVDPRGNQEVLEVRKNFGTIPHTVAVAAMVMVLTAPVDLRRGTLYPFSRRDRAEVVWRASLQKTAWVLLALGVVFSTVGVLAALLGGRGLALHRVPELFVALAVTAMFLPLLQWLRLRCIESLPRHTSPTNYAVLIGITATFFALLQAVIVMSLRDAEARAVGIFALGVAPVLILCAQLLFRVLLRSWFARADLV